MASGLEAGVLKKTPIAQNQKARWEIVSADQLTKRLLSAKSELTDTVCDAAMLRWRNDSTNRRFKVRMNAITGPKVRAWWFNPRNAEATRIGEFTNTEEREFVPPDNGELLDWILVLDDAAQNFPPPGASMLK